MSSEGITRRALLKYAIGGTIGVASLGAAGWLAVNRYRNKFEVQAVRSLMKTYVSVTALAEDPEHGHQAVEAAFRGMGKAVDVLSRFESHSPVAVLNRTGQVRNPPADLYAVLKRARYFSDISEGSFDVTVMPVLDYYYELAHPIDLKKLDRSAVAMRERLVGYRDLIFDREYVHFTRPGMALTLDGIAKGYVVDRGMAVLKEHGLEDAIIDAGGDVRFSSGKDPGHYWTIGISDPQNTRRLCASVHLRNGAMATSGNYEIFFSSDHRLFHIINPHTGYSPDMYSSVTVLADRSVDSDALGVTLFSLGLPRIRDLMQQEGKQWFIVSWDGKARWRSQGFPLASGSARVV